MESLIKYGSKDPDPYLIKNYGSGSGRPIRNTEHNICGVYVLEITKFVRQSLRMWQHQAIKDMQANNF